ncbi:MAG: TatD family hydrolase [Candidatus Sericytochromatia bacterium]
MNNLFDSHAHINLHFYKDDIDSVLKRMLDDGINKVVIPGIDIETVRSAIELAEKHPNFIYTAVGYHPQDAIKWEDSLYQELTELSKNSTVVAVGEVGLDYYWDTTPRDVQHDVLKKQINLAKELDLPLIIHTRESQDDTLEILKKYNAESVGGVFHCFSGDVEFAKRCIDLGFYISFAGNITFKNAQNLRDVAKEIPLEHILIETDSPYLTPVPNRGKRNEPYNVKYVAQQVATLKDLDFDVVADITYKNAIKLFNISES